MDPALLIVCLVSIAAIILFITEWLPIDVTALSVSAILMATGVLSVDEGLSGFSNSATITIMALFMVSRGWEQTGLVKKAGDLLISKFNSGEGGLIILLTLISGVVSAFVNNTAVVVIFLPIVLQIARLKNIPASKLLMPLSFAAMAGGCCTLIGTSTNLLVNSLGEQFGLPTMSMFEFLPIGILLLLTTVVYMRFIGRKLLPGNDNNELTDDYAVKAYLVELEILEKGLFEGKTIAQTPFGKQGSTDVIEIIRRDGEVWLPEQIEKLKTGDKLIVRADKEEILEFENIPGLAISHQGRIGDTQLHTGASVLFEAIIGPKSTLPRKMLSEVGFRDKYGVVPLAVRKQGTNRVEDLGDIVMRFGDVLLMETKREDYDQLSLQEDFIVLSPLEREAKRSKLAGVSFLIGAFVVISAAFGFIPIVVSAICGALLMVISRCMSMREAYQSVEWKIIFMLSGILPLGIAIKKTGAHELAASGAIDLLTGMPDQLILGIAFIFTSATASFISNQAAAVLLIPIGMSLANGLGIDSKWFLITMMMAANTSFLTPIGYQTNVLIFGPGKYRFTDFTKTGGLLMLIFAVMVSLLVPVFYG